MIVFLISFVSKKKTDGTTHLTNHFGSSHCCSKSCCSCAHLSFFLLCIQVKRIMPRKGWSAVVHDLQFPSGRVRRPSRSQQKPYPKVGHPPVVQFKRWSRMGVGRDLKIGRIRAAIASLGPGNIEEGHQFGSRIATCGTSRSVPPVEGKKRIATESTKIVNSHRQRKI